MGNYGDCDTHPHSPRRPRPCILLSLIFPDPDIQSSNTNTTSFRPVTFGSGVGQGGFLFKVNRGTHLFPGGPGLRAEKKHNISMDNGLPTNRCVSGSLHSTGLKGMIVRFFFCPAEPQLSYRKNRKRTRRILAGFAFYRRG